MTEEDRIELKSWFMRYVREFRYDDPERQRPVDLKEEHTHRVCDTMNRITAALGLSENDRRIAETAALFHDVGRFRQYRDYGTFRDPDSANHAVLSLKALAESRSLLRLPKDERHLIVKSIFLHNKIRLPNAVTGRTRLFAALLPLLKGEEGTRPPRRERGAAGVNGRDA